MKSFKILPLRLYGKVSLLVKLMELVKSKKPSTII